MNIFYEMASRLGFYKDVKNCLLKGFTPCAVTGVSNIHKAQTAGFPLALLYATMKRLPLE